MKAQDVRKVRQLLEKYGDSFWSEEFDGCNNTILFEEILEILNRVGYDLKLLKPNN